MAQVRKRRTTKQAPAVVAEEVVAVEVATEDAPAEDSVPSSAPTPEPSPSLVRIINRDLTSVYVPLAGDSLRLGPKEAAPVAASEVTEATRRLEAEERIFIRNL